jgi:hypothetical protein
VESWVCCLDGFYDLHEFRINLQILNEKVKSAAQETLKEEEALGPRRDRVNFEQGRIALTDEKNGLRGDTPRCETVQSTLTAIGEKGRHFFPTLSMQTLYLGLVTVF